MRATLLVLMVGLSLIAFSSTAAAGHHLPDVPRPGELVPSPTLPEPMCLGGSTMQIGPLTICDPWAGNPPW
jgi:hypothetical protein